MSRLLACLLVAAVAAPALAVPMHSLSRTSVRAAPRLGAGWTELDPADPNHKLDLVFSLEAHNFEALTATALAVSDPSSPLYGQFLSATEIAELTQPAQEDINTITAWLHNAGVKFTASRRKATIEVACSVAQAEALLATQFRNVIHPETNTKSVRGGDYTLPANVASKIAGVFGVHGLPLTAKRAHVSAEPANVTPSVIYKTYNVSGVDVSRNTKNRQAVGEYQGEFMNTTDLETFFTQLVPNAQPGDDQVYSFHGDKQEGDGVEAQLDIQYIMGVGVGVKTEFWEYANTDFCRDLKKWTAELVAGDDIPFVHSISYGWQGDLTQIGCLSSEVTSVDNDFTKLAARGISIIFASGDSGSGWDGDKMWPSWPASSPWVTAVGSTRFLNQQPGSGEQATDQFGSGGGFSAQFDQGTWQKDAVTTFLNTATDLPPASYFPAGGRATPDVSALGEGYSVYNDGDVISVGGTSASAPCFAGLVSLLNEARINAGGKPLGFLNPFLYNNTQAFRDVTHGDNRIGRGGETLQYGYSAIAGWDPATGLGTPNFGALLKAALK